MGNKVGVSCLMSAVTLSHGLRQLMCARRGCAVLCLPSLANHLFYSKLLGFRDTDEFKYRNGHLKCSSVALH